MQSQQQNSIVKPTVIFIVLAAVFVVLIVASINVSDSFGKGLMVSLGSAIFGSGLTFFLIQVFK